MLFPRTALAARKPGDEAPANGARDALNERCVFVLRSDIPAILGRLRDNEQARPPRKKARHPQREPRPDDERTLAAIRALMAEGAPACAVQLLTSAGLHDPDNQAVQLKLAELHPVGSRIMAPFPIAWNKTGTWGASEIEAMRGILYSFRRGAQGDHLVCFLSI